MDEELVREADRLARSTGQSRSAVVARALRSFLAEHRREREVDRYVEALRETAETTSEVGALDEVGVDALSSVDWDDR